MVMGFHNRASAIGAETTNVHAFVRPGEKKSIKYTEDYVLRRARMIPLAIDARRQRYPDEVPYEYQGSYIGEGVWNAEARAEISPGRRRVLAKGHHALANPSQVDQCVGCRRPVPIFAQFGAPPNSKLSPKPD